MTAGLFLRGRVWRFTYPTDDKIGGAVPSGTVVYDNVNARLEAVEPTMALLEQGLETPTIFTGLLSPGNLIIKHNDQFEVTGPAISPYVNEKFRVIGMSHASMIDARSFLVVTLRRIEEARTNAYQ